MNFFSLLSLPKKKSHLLLLLFKKMIKLCRKKTTQDKNGTKFTKRVYGIVSEIVGKRTKTSNTRQKE